VKEGKGDFGYNAASDKYENLVKAGVIDPVKVVRTALQNAASIASLLLTTEALVRDPGGEEGGAAAACRAAWAGCTSADALQHGAAPRGADAAAPVRRASRVFFHPQD
jgi:hypothetical protein